MAAKNRENRNTTQRSPGREAPAGLATEGPAENLKLIPLADVPKLPWLPRRDKPIHLATVYRYAKDGRRGHRLRTVRSFGGRCTTEQWLWEFFEAIGESGGRSAAVPAAHRPPAKRRRDHQRAEQALHKAGF